MNDLDTLYPKWTEAVRALPYGVAKAFHDVFTAAAHNDTHLVYGQDYYNHYPCLVNTVGVMLKATGGKGGSGLPAQHFGEVVELFDSINRELLSAGANTEQYLVSPLSADIFLSHFPDMEEWKDEIHAYSKTIDAPYVEVTDDEMAAEIASLFTDGPACEITISDDIHLDVLLNSDQVPENVVLGSFNRSPE